MSRQWVVNASPIISLGRIGHLGLLEQLCTELIIPEPVARELIAGPDDDPARIWIEGKGASHLRPCGASHPLSPAADLGPGKSSVINLAITMRLSEVVLDDLEARRVATGLGLNVLRSSVLVGGGWRCCRDRARRSQGASALAG